VPIKSQTAALSIKRTVASTTVTSLSRFSSEGKSSAISETHLEAVVHSVGPVTLESEVVFRVRSVGVLKSCNTPRLRNTTRSNSYYRYGADSPNDGSPNVSPKLRLR
jgi:hypothetical protein